MASTVRIQYGMHARAAETRSMKEHVDWCDVYVPEMAGWTPPFVAMYQMVADGQISIMHAMNLLGQEGVEFADFMLGELTQLFGTQKRVLIADMPRCAAHDRLYQLHERVDVLPGIQMPFSMIVMLVQNILEEVADIHGLREEYIAIQLLSICELPSGKRPHRVFVRIGAGHSHLSRILRQQGVEVEVVREQPCTVFSILERVIRYGALGLPLPSDMAERKLLCNLIWQFGLGNPDQDAAVWDIPRNNILSYVNAVTNNAPAGFTEMLWGACYEKNDCQAFVRGELASIGFPVPRTLMSRSA